MTNELIGIREASRRLGVSDTAVRKAIESGRVTVMAYTEKSGRPLLEWPQVQTDWRDNTDVNRRRNVGASESEYLKPKPPPLVKPFRPRPVKLVPPVPVPVQPVAPAQAEAETTDGEGTEAGGPKKIMRGPATAEELAHIEGVRLATPDDVPADRPTQAQSKAKREYYLALQAKLDYEESIGKMVSADDVKIRWTKLITAAKTKILGIPANCKARNADLSLKTIAIIEEVCRQALDDLANERD